MKKIKKITNMSEKIPCAKKDLKGLHVQVQSFMGFFMQLSQLLIYERNDARQLFFYFYLNHQDCWTTKYSPTKLKNTTCTSRGGNKQGSTHE